MAYGWITTAPIRKVDAAEAIDIGAELAANIASWGKGSESWDSKDGPSRRYHANTTDAVRLLGGVDKGGFARDSYTYYAYFYGGSPLGLLVMAPSDFATTDLTISDLVTHPGSEGCGSILLEFAVNLSQAKGFNGKLTLTSLNHNATSFYLKMGFTKTMDMDLNFPHGAFYMELAPAKCPTIWKLSTDRWALIAYSGKKFAGTPPAGETKVSS